MERNPINLHHEEVEVFLKGSLSTLLLVVLVQQSEVWIGNISVREYVVLLD